MTMEFSELISFVLMILLFKNRVEA